MDGGEREGVFRERGQLRVVVGKAAARAAERERRAQHHGVADLARRRAAFGDARCDLAREHRLAERLAQRLELLAVLRAGDALRPRAEHLDLALLQHALLRERHHEVQSRLSADAGHDRVRALIADDARHIFRRERLHIYLVRDRGVGHDRRGVGVCEHDLIALLAQGETGLRAGVVKFGGLSDHDRARADHEDLVDVGSLRHGGPPPFRRV